MTPTRVLFATHSAALSGAELMLHGMLSRTTGVEPLVVLGEEGPLAARLEQIGVEVHVLSSPTWRGEVGTAWSAFRSAGAAARGMPHLLRGMQRLVERLRPDVVYSNSARSHVTWVPVARSLRVPVVMHLHDHLDREFFSPPVLTALRVASRLPDLLIANSMSTRDTVPRAARQRAQVVYCPTELPDRSPSLPAQRRQPGEPLRVGCFGRISAWKGQHLAVEACEALARRGHQVELGIFGEAQFDGDRAYQRQLTERVVRSPVGEAITLHGHVDVRDHLPTCDVVVHTSTRPEPFGQVVVEAMAQGVPVVAADAGGPREIVTSGVDGLLYPMGDALALSRALESLVVDPGERWRLGERGRVRAADFSYDAVLPRWERLVRSAASRVAPRPT